jgi:hypothetical protein
LISPGYVSLSGISTFLLKSRAAHHPDVQRITFAFFGLSEEAAASARRMA